MTDLTPEQNRAKAGEALTRAAKIGPATDLYRNLVLTSIAHVLLAVAAYLEPPPVPQVPGLPLGYQVDIQQAGRGERKYRYILTCPDGRTQQTRYQWDYARTALEAAIRHAAIDLAAPADTGNGHGRTAP